MFGLSSTGISAGQGLAGAAGVAGLGLGGAAFLPLLSTASMFGEGIANNYWAYKNYNLQKDQYSYEQNLQQLLMAREDTAVRRRAADMRAAGINPVLAAGQGAQAGPVVSTQPPQMGKISGMSEAAQSALGLMSMQANISKTAAEEKYTLQQNVKSQAERKLIEEQMKQVEAQTQNIKTATAEKWWNLKQAQDAGVRTNASGMVGQAVDTISAVKNIMLRKAETQSERDARLKAAKAAVKGRTGYDSKAPITGYDGKAPKMWYEK